ncbi:hypothetical protein [Bhargavaea cecembensis]|uniref:hypothetical protein n=1 Tax=Bhargavaea cecembensis TaxID=394098 RepID=UPI001177AB41|nr:hypothetical protein [Bhargavaea cecembensis]
MISSLPLSATEALAKKPEEPGKSLEHKFQGENRKQIREIPAMRNRNSKVFSDEEGNYFAEVYLDPIHFEENGEWLDIDNTLKDSETGTVFENTDNEFSVEFPKQLFSESSEILSYETGGHVMEMSLEGQSVNEKQFADGSKVKENIILQAYEGKNQFQFKLSIDGV